ncbi:MAG TPA: hypothetical protein VGL76_04220 [Gaiellaceae bacterium]
MNRATLSNVCAIAAAACGIVAIVTRPFLLAPLGLIFLLIGARANLSRRFTGPAAVVLTLGALAGTAVAVGFTKPLY